MSRFFRYKIKQDDGPSSSLTGLRIDHDHFDFRTLGNQIREHTHLNLLRGDLLPDEHLPDAYFFECLKCNHSIRELVLRGDSCEGLGYKEFLNAFAEKHNSLTKLSVVCCDRGFGGLTAFTSTIQRFTKLECIDVRFSHFGENRSFLGQFVTAVRDLRQVEKLNMAFNRIRRDSCDALATLLQDPNSTLRGLHLGDNNIDDVGIAVLANSLAKNTQLESLNLENNRMITRTGLNSFLQVICNTSSIHATYFSNHVLKNLGVCFRVLSNDMVCNMTLNNNANKKDVAMKKIQWKHQHFDMEPFFRWNMKMLPVVVGWFNRAKCLGRHNEANTISAIYQFIHAMPEIFEPTPLNIKGEKNNGKTPFKGKRRRSCSS